MYFDRVIKDRHDEKGGTKWEKFKRKEVVKREDNKILSSVNNDLITFGSSSGCD